MKRSVEILVHLFFWIAFIALTWMLTRVYLKADPDAPFSHHLGYVIFLELIMGLLFFYITFFGIRWAGKRKGRFAILAITLICLLVFFAYPALSHGIIPVVSSLIPHIVLVFLALIFRKYSDAQRMENDKKELLFRNVQSELALLKMQLSPHFLFNTLNNIDFLIHQNARKASDSISKLGTILRYMIYEADAEKINLSEEIKHTEDYIELLRLRVLNPDYLTYKPSVINGSFLIAPMLFLPLIENAFKHASTREGENIIRISISVKEGILDFTVSNVFTDSLQPDETGSGLGLKNVKRRLELIYPDTHSLLILKKEDRFIVELKLQLDEDKMFGSG
jgi:two-component system, LytTR family, sensor kinase